MISRVRRGLVAWAVIATLGVVALPGARPAAAQSTNAGAPVLALVSQDSWVRPGGMFTMHLRAEPPPRAESIPSTAGLNVVLILHDRVSTRTAFDASATDPTAAQPNPALPTQLGSRISAPFDSLDLDASGNRVFAIPLLGPNDPELPDHLNARRPGGGPYPLEVQLRDANDQRVSGFVTYVVVAELVSGTGEGAVAPVWAGGRPLDVAWVWPLVAAPAYLPDGNPDPAVVDELAPTGRLGRQAAQIDALTDVPLTLVPSPETADAWQAISRQRADLVGGIGALGRAVTHDEILTGPFVSLDLPAMTAGGMEQSFDSELTRGTATLDRVLGQRLDPRTALAGPLDQHSLQLLRQRSVDRLVLADPSALAPANEQFTPARPVVVQSTPGDETTTVTTVVGDAGFQRMLSGDQPSALRAARLIAGLAVVAREQPGLQRGITIVNPADWTPDEAFVAAVAAGLRANPFLRPVTVSSLVADVPAAEGAPRTLSARPAATATVTPRQLAVASANVGAISTLLGPADPIVARGERAIAASLYAGWQTTDGRGRARALLDSIGGSVNGFLSGIRIPSSTTITVTSSKAEIPITFRNDTGKGVQVHVRFSSDKLLFPGGNDHDINLPPRNTTLRFAVETRTSGTFPISVTLTTAGATPLPIQSTQLRVRSTFVSGVGIFLTVGAGAFLALWWGWDIRKRRRARRAHGPHAGAATASS